jgi:hypothetical protein
MEVYLYHKTSQETKILEIQYSQAVTILREVRKKCKDVGMICDKSLDSMEETYKGLKPFRVVDSYEELIKY